MANRVGCYCLWLVCFSNLIWCWWMAALLGLVSLCSHRPPLAAPTATSFPPPSNKPTLLCFVLLTWSWLRCAILSLANIAPNAKCQKNIAQQYIYNHDKERTEIHMLEEYYEYKSEQILDLMDAIQSPFNNVFIQINRLK